MNPLPDFIRVCRDLLVQIDGLNMEYRATHDSQTLYKDVLRILPTINDKMYDIILRKEKREGVHITIIVCHKLHSNKWIAKKVIESLGGKLPELNEDSTPYQLKLRAELFEAMQKVLDKEGMEQFPELLDDDAADGLRETMVAITFQTLLEAFTQTHEENMGTYMLDMYDIDVMSLADEYIKASKNAKTMVSSIYEDMGL